MMQQQPEKKPEQQPERRRETCPRCESTSTKFCYFNNYSTEQPRYYCRTCKRYWTKGGSLRNIPIGGTSRKPRHSRRRSDRASPPTSVPASAPPPPPQPQNPPANDQQLQQIQAGNETGENPVVFPAALPSFYYNGAGRGLLPPLPVRQPPINPVMGGFRSFTSMVSAASLGNPSLHGFHFQLHQQQQYRPQYNHHQQQQQQYRPQYNHHHQQQQQQYRPQHNRHHQQQQQYQPQYNYHHHHQLQYNQQQQYQPQYNYHHHQQQYQLQYNQQQLLAVEKSLLLQPSSSTRPATTTSSAADLGFLSSQSGQLPPSSSAPFM